MASSSELEIVDLDTGDIEAGLLLSDEAGWNQTGDDWRIFIQHGMTIGVRDAEGRLVASAATLPYESRLAFVSMTLVTANWRRRGLATRLVDLCLVRLRDRGLTPVLDATPEGAAVYSQQGFRALFDLDRWQANIDSEMTVGDIPPVKAADGSDLDVLIRLDEETAGAARPFLIRDFFGRSGTCEFLSMERNGFIMIRRGRKALQIGPLVAASQEDAIALCHHALRVVKGAVYIDVPTVQRDFGQWLQARGFTRQRSFSRMALARTNPFGALGRLFSSAGPEFG